MNRSHPLYRTARDIDAVIEANRLRREARLRAHRRRLALVAVLCLAGAFGLAVLTVLVLL